MSDCKHPRLVLLEGPIHVNDNPPVYACQVCGEQLNVTMSKATIGVHFGTLPTEESVKPLRQS